MLKQFYFWAALSWTGIIIFFCLVKSSSIPVVHFQYLDKIVHAFFHFVFTSLWFLFLKEQLNSHTVFKPLTMSLMFSIFFGIGIEILQEVCTTTRSGDLFDVFANISGAILAVCMILMLRKYKFLYKI